MKLDRRTVLKTTAAAFGAGTAGWMPGAVLAAPLTRAIAAAFFVESGVGLPKYQKLAFAQKHRV